MTRRVPEAFGSSRRSQILGLRGQDRPPTIATFLIETMRVVNQHAVTNTVTILMSRARVRIYIGQALSSVPPLF